MFMDTNNIGVLPAVTDVLNAATVTSAPQLNNLSQRRFRFLYDKVETLVVGGADQQVHVQRTFKPNTPVTYGASTNITTANHKNAIFVLAITDLAANPPFYAWDVLVRYTDA